MSAPAVVRGWCPGAWRPMMSGDGLVVRIRPRLARLERDQVLGLCDLARQYGSGFIDLTNRANLQIRGVAEGGFEPLLERLAGLGLLDADPVMEGRRNILVSPFWDQGDLTWRIARALIGTLPHLPGLPSKFGFSVDCGPAPLLTGDPADIRIERGPDGLVLRLDGTSLGRPVAEAEVQGAVVEMSAWFAAHQTPEARRMAKVVAQTTPPADWTVAPPLPAAPHPAVGPAEHGALLGAAFGQIDAEALARAIQDTGARALRVTPWRLFLLEGAEMPEGTPFVTRPGDPLLDTDACPGAPFCPQATVETRELARDLAARTAGSLHVSGCAKGCARPSPAATTLVGREGRFGLVKDGYAWDAPVRSGLGRDEILAETLSGTD